MQNKTPKASLTLTKFKNNVTITFKVLCRKLNKTFETSSSYVHDDICFATVYYTKRIVCLHVFFFFGQKTRKKLLLKNCKCFLKKEKLMLKAYFCWVVSSTTSLG